MALTHYILDGHTPVPLRDILYWSGWMQTTSRRVARTEMAHDVSVSTVFLGLDHAFGGGPPLLFETMVFGGPLDQEQVRYATWDEADAGHVRLCALVRQALSASDTPTEA